MARQKLTPRQLEVLRWISGGCPERDWPDETHKHTARALMSRGLVHVARKHKVWTATTTDHSRYYLEHGRYPPAPEPIRERS